MYKVVSGSVRTYKILSDGRRQIGGFYLPGDIFGFEFADEHSCSAEAITDAKVLGIKRKALATLADRDATVAREFFALTARELRRVQDRVLLLNQERPGARGQLPPGNGRTRPRWQRHRIADGAAGYRRLSGLDHRDGLANTHRAGKLRRDRGPELTAHCAAQSVYAQSYAWLIWFFTSSHCCYGAQDQKRWR